MLTRCTFNGQQCCPQFVIDEFDNAMRLAFNNGTIPFTRSFADAQKAVDEMRKDATSMHYVYINLCKIICILSTVATIKYLHAY